MRSRGAWYGGSDADSERDPRGESAAEELLPLVYNELRRLAAVRIACERPGQTLQEPRWSTRPTCDWSGTKPRTQWKHRGHFFAVAAEAMRRIRENARRKHRLRHGGEY